MIVGRTAARSESGPLTVGTTSCPALPKRVAEWGSLPVVIRDLVLATQPVLVFLNASKVLWLVLADRPVSKYLGNGIAQVCVVIGLSAPIQI